MPELERFFHYRNLDVSTLEGAGAALGAGGGGELRQAGNAPRLADIHESIRELRHYRARLFAPAWGGAGCLSALLLTHRGGCHCGAVAFEVEAPARLTVSECNCSICRMTGYLHLIVPRARFRLLSGAEASESSTASIPGRRGICSADAAA